MFMKRVLALHQLSTKRGGKAANARLSQSDWNVEADRMAVMSYVIHEMRTATADDGSELFPPDIIEKLLKRAVEGPFEPRPL